jgi:hypothetical protein
MNSTAITEEEIRRQLGVVQRFGTENLTPITEEEIQKGLHEHQLWLETSGKEGIWLDWSRREFPS